MKFRLCALAALTACVATQTPAFAASFMSGNAVHSACQDASEPTNWGFCRGYIVGAIDAYLAYGEALHLPQKFCLPEHVTVEQMADLGEQYIQQHPEDRHSNAASMVFLALYGAFPCPPATR